MDFASWGRPGGSLGALLERLGGFFGRLEAIWGALERFVGPRGLSRGLWRLAEELPEAPGSAQERPGVAGNRQERPGAPGNPRESLGKAWVRAPKKLSAPLPRRAAGLHEPWGTPLHAEGTVADNLHGPRVLSANIH